MSNLKKKIANKLKSLNEGKWSKIMQSVRKYPQGPFTIVAILDGKVVDQHISITNPQMIPAHYEAVKRKHPSARISIENGEGLSVYNESVSEGTVSPEQLKKNTEDLVKTAKDSLDLADDKSAKDYVSGFIGVDESEGGLNITNRVNDIIKTLKGNGVEPTVDNIVVASLFSVGGTLGGHENEIASMLGQSNGIELESSRPMVKQEVNPEVKPFKRPQVKQEVNPEVKPFKRPQVKQEVNPEVKPFKRPKIKQENNGLDYGMSPEVEADKYEEYRALMAQLAAEEGGEEQPVKEVDEQQTNDPVKLKADVTKVMNKLDMSSIAPYLDKIDNPTEESEMIAQFAEKIGVPKQKLSSVIAQLKTVAENTNPKMTKNKLFETVTGKKVIKTIKVKDIK